MRQRRKMKNIRRFANLCRGRPACLPRWLYVNPIQGRPACLPWWLYVNPIRGRPACLPRWLYVNPIRGRHTGLPLPYTQLQTDLGLSQLPTLLLIFLISCSTSFNALGQKRSDRGANDNKPQPPTPPV